MGAVIRTAAQEILAVDLTKHKNKWGSETLSEKRSFVHAPAGKYGLFTKERRTRPVLTRKIHHYIVLVAFVSIIIYMFHVVCLQSGNMCHIDVMTQMSFSPLLFSKSTDTFIGVRGSNGSFHSLGYLERLTKSPALWSAAFLKEEDKIAFCSAAYLDKARIAVWLLWTGLRYSQEENLVLWTVAILDSAIDETLALCIVELQNDHLNAETTRAIIPVLLSWTWFFLTIATCVLLEIARNHIRVKKKYSRLSISTETVSPPTRIFPNPIIKSNVLPFLFNSNVEKAVQPHTDYSIRFYNAVESNDVETKSHYSNNLYSSNSNVVNYTVTCSRRTPEGSTIESVLEKCAINVKRQKLFHKKRKISIVHRKAITCTEKKATSHCSGCSNVTSTPSTTSTSEGEKPEVTNGDDTEHSSTPVFSQKWEHSSIFSSRGGRLRKPGSDVFLDIPTKGAVDAGAVEKIHTAVCADVDEMRAVLEVHDGAQIASPLAEYWVRENFAFNSEVIISLPHFLPADFNMDGVHVYRITSAYDGRKHDSSLCSQGLGTEGAPLIASKLGTVRVQEVFSFIVEGDAVKIFTSHFCGFVCVYCDKKTDKEPKRPKLYMAAGGNISTSGAVQHVDISAYVWDERLKVADCRQKQGIDGITNASMGEVALLEKLKDTQIRLLLKLDDDTKSVLVHRIQTDGQPAFPFQQGIDTPRFLCCKKCTNKGKLSHKKVQWALKSQPGKHHIQSLECAVEVTHVAKDQDHGLKVTTPLVIKLVCKDEERMERPASRPQRGLKQLFAKSRENRPVDRTQLNLVAKNESPTEASGSAHGSGWSLPPVQQRSDEERTLNGVVKSTAHERRMRSFRLQAASSTSSELEGAVGGADVNPQLAQLSSEQRLILKASELREIFEAGRRAEAHRQRLERELEAQARRAERAESAIKVLQWQLHQRSYIQVGFQDDDNPSNSSDITRPSQRRLPNMRTASTEPALYITNPSLATTSETNSDNSYQSCSSCGEDFSPRCCMDNLK